MNAKLPFSNVKMSDEFGHSYSFRVLGPGEAAPFTAGLYAYAKIETIGIGIAMSNPRIEIGYVGKTDDGLRNRLAGHEVTDDAIAWGATHILVFEAQGWTAEVRAELEIRLIRFYDPPLNKQHRRILRRGQA